MSRQARRPVLSEKGLLTPDNSVVALIDLQPQMLFGVANFDRQSVINNNLVLTKAARAFDVPVVLSTVETKSFSGKMWPQIPAVADGHIYTVPADLVAQATTRLLAGLELICADLEDARSELAEER